jgi:SepF-like predicted cell division protein (DUF552 family)
MSAIELKTQFHQLIDETNDYDFLQNSLNLFVAHNQKTDILDLLNVQQKADLYTAIEQVKAGNVVSNDVVRAEIQLKINQCLTK